MAAGGAEATLERLLPLASQQSLSAKEELQQKIQELPFAELGPLWKAVFETLKTCILQVIADEMPDKDCLPYLAICHAGIKADLPVCTALSNTASFLHGVIPILEEGQVVKAAHAICETWCTKKLSGWKGLWLNTFTRTVQLSVQKGPKARAERLVASVFLMRGSLVVVDNELDAVELSAEERKLLYEHLARCAVSPNYLGSPKGKKFIAFLLALDKPLAMAIYKLVDEALANMTSPEVQTLAQAYAFAWKAVCGQPQAEVLEESMQEIMYWTVNGDLKADHHENLFKFLKVLHVQRRDRAFANMLCRSYFPILWRGLKARHYEVRHWAAKIFFDSFPLLENTQVALQQEELSRHFAVMQDLLADTCPHNRALAVRGVLKAMSDYFELFPMHERKALAKTLLDKNAQDMNSLDSRVRVNQGLAYMVGNPLTHSMLKVLIAKNKDALHDSCSVQLSFINLLLEARKIVDFKFWEVTPPEELLSLMADSRPRMAYKLATLLRNSYFNPEADRMQQLNRCLLLHSICPAAFRVFYSQLTKIAPLKPILEFLATICFVLRRECQALRKSISKENMLPDDPDLASLDLNSDLGVSGSDKKPLDQHSLHIFTEALAITYNDLSIRKELTSDELKPFWKKLVTIMRKTVTELFQSTDTVLPWQSALASEAHSSASSAAHTERNSSLSMQISVLSAASLLPKDEASNLALRCLSMLRGYLTVPDTGAPALLPAEAEMCVFFLCNMNRAADVLAIVAESVEELHNKQTPCKRGRRVRFNVQRRPCSPDVGLQVLRLLLVSPQLQLLLIKHHLVPLFDAWNALLRIAATLQELLCISNGNMIVPSVMMLAFELFLLLTYVLNGQQHPLTKEKFVATATFERQMSWMQDSLLPKVPTQREALKDLSMQAIQAYLKMARSVFVTKWATFEFAQTFLNFLALCKATAEVDSLMAEIALVPPIMRKYRRMFARSEEQVSAIEELLEKIDVKCPPPKEAKRRSSSGKGGGAAKTAPEQRAGSADADSPGRPASR
ncbi:uncharacterized protein LOC144179147 isoform X4 [Haemaphysalis longicornis]